MYPVCSLHREGFRVGVSCVFPAGGGAQGGCVVCSSCRGRGLGWVCPVCSLQGEERVRVSQFTKDGKLMKTYFDDVTTLYEGFLRGKLVSGEYPAP